ncbi:sensor histidine kinase [Amycolatopsis sacchari]|uniref:Histidine kinase-, DNA gyrase B-, and HSP90-like ATPase n=1 Tax=Amycolatopsis sacchari TaxID=115433 RepID=A0A1I3VPY2_9PSEU|nr:histidine kinase [Amycolatopsis sacchari]SFJ96317.1 Histidine kinase-, DNA gyrase B-, and HSP90-like ATPase [Amycolatopsis sacchari]
MPGLKAPAVDVAALALDAPDGLALVDPGGRFAWLNHAAARLCGREVLGAPSPFTAGEGEQSAVWTPEPEVRREFAYRTRGLPDGSTLVSFRDVTDERHRQRRLAALASTAANLASQGSLPEILDALASEVLRTDALAAVQILALDDSGAGLRIMGSAGFRHWPDFFPRLMECRRRGASLKMLEAFETGEPVVVPDRGAAIQRDPAWRPLAHYMGELDWETFASVPLLVRGAAVGVLNAFFLPGHSVGPQTVEFLLAMAEQAAMAVDYAGLLRREREDARREERQRLARDLHDSIVQQVFSISMQAKSLEVLGQRGDSVPVAAVARIAGEVGSLSHTVLADLRAMVHELRPSTSAELGGLEEAIRALADSTANRTGLKFGLTVGRGAGRLTGELAEDVYRVVAEAIHNVVKHAGAEQVSIRLAVRDGRFTATVTDDGCGIGAAGPGGYGLRTMRERAERWGGTVTVRRHRRSGTVVRLVVPVDSPAPSGS